MTGKMLMSEFHQLGMGEGGGMITAKISHNTLRIAMKEKQVLELAVWGQQPGMTEPDWMVSMVNFEYVGLAVPCGDPSQPMPRTMPHPENVAPLPVQADPGMAAADDTNFEEIANRA